MFLESEIHLYPLPENVHYAPPYPPWKLCSSNQKTNKITDKLVTYVTKKLKHIQNECIRKTVLSCYFCETYCICSQNKAYGFFSNCVSTLDEDGLRLFGNVGLLLLNFFFVEEDQIRYILEKMADTQETVVAEEKRIAQWVRNAQQVLQDIEKEIDFSNEQSVINCLKKLSYNQVQFKLRPIFLNGDVGGVDSSILSLVAQCAEIKSFLKATELEESEIIALKWTSVRWCQDKTRLSLMGCVTSFVKITSQNFALLAFSLNINR
jgi:hypothetical protein